VSEHDAGDDAAYARPPGVDGTFAHRAEPPAYGPPPRTVSPEERAVFSRPPGAESFAPAPGERILPRPADRAPVPGIFAQAFGPPAEAQDGFAPAPGTRLPPTGPAPESPWWKADAPHDPWRDPRAPFWLGRGAIFTGGRPEQLEPEQDADADELVVGLPEVADADEPDNVRRLRFGPSMFAIVAVAALIAGVLGGGAGWWLAKNVRDALHRPDVSIAQVETPVKRDPGSGGRRRETGRAGGGVDRHQHTERVRDRLRRRHRQGLAQLPISIRCRERTSATHDQGTGTTPLICAAFRPTLTEWW
jgi:hypothetical protein